MINIIITGDRIPYYAREINEKIPFILDSIGHDVAGNALVLINECQGRDPYGSAWPVLSKATLDARKKKNEEARKQNKKAGIEGDCPLLDTGVMRDSFNYLVTGNGVIVGDGTAYGRAHQFGYRHIPALPYFDDERGISPGTRESIERNINHFLSRL